MLKQKIEQDLKSALLAGDKDKVSVLRGLKSVMLYAEVAQGARETGLDDKELLSLFAKEAKKRQESADLYLKGGNPQRAEAEMAEKKIIEAYLPQQLSDEDLQVMVGRVITELGATSLQDMGKVIAAVKQQAEGQADGGRIARVVKENLQQ